MPRYRLQYLHLATSAKLTFTLETDGLEGRARGAGSDWIVQSGLQPIDFAFLSVVNLGPGWVTRPPFVAPTTMESYEAMKGND